MTLQEQAKYATHLMRLLKVRYVSVFLAKTEKGDLFAKFTKDQDTYDLILDAVPLSMNDYDNRELKSIVEKYAFPSTNSSFTYSSTAGLATVGVDFAKGDSGTITTTKKPGRPKKK